MEDTGCFENMPRPSMMQLYNKMNIAKKAVINRQVSNPPRRPLSVTSHPFIVKGHVPPHLKALVYTAMPVRNGTLTK